MTLHRRRAHRCSALLELPGAGASVAGTLLAEVGDPQRFPTADHFASYCRAAPVERGSGQNSRMQVNPGGNRRLNWALHIIALVRLRIDGGRSRQFMAKQTDHGKTKRCLALDEDLYRTRSVQNNSSILSWSRLFHCLTTIYLLAAHRAIPGTYLSRSVSGACVIERCSSLSVPFPPNLRRRSPFFVRLVHRCRVGGGALARWPPSAAQTARTVFPYAAFTKMRSCEVQWKVLTQ